jgi:hypothetical protein
MTSATVLKTGSFPNIMIHYFIKVLLRGRNQYSFVVRKELELTVYSNVSCNPKQAKLLQLVAHLPFTMIQKLTELNINLILRRKEANVKLGYILIDSTQKHTPSQSNKSVQGTQYSLV